MSSFRSAKAISGSIIQNSARWRAVLLFSARKVGPKVYTRPSAVAPSSASSCPLTVRLVTRPKKSSEGSVPLVSSRVVTRNISPAPSASLAVMMGLWK